jgi:hypothetical protein
VVDCSRVTHPFATGFLMYCYTRKPVRLACLNHAASVHSEPGSNSPKRIRESRILVIHELLENPSSEDDRTRTGVRVLEYVDWGSQSIAQSKFQRTVPTEGKDFQEDIWNFCRQYFSRKFPKKVLGRNACLAGPLIASLALRHEVLTEGTAENANAVLAFKIFL